jgi:S-adenosylmethionine hydrolase
MDSSTPRPVVAVMTDFGQGDGDVGVMKGVITSIVPDVHLIDITHEVAPQNVLSAAWILAASYRYFPKGTVFVCVIDPGVGSERGAIAVHAGDWLFVGPDNGLFSYVYQEQEVHAAVTLSNPAYRLPQVSTTFHGRDIFAPAGAHLARGIALHEFGAAIAPSTLVRLQVGKPIRRGNQIMGQVIHIDHFGNTITNIPLTMVPELADNFQMQIVFPDSNVIIDRRRRYFADGSEDDQPFIYGDSSGYLAIAVRNGNAARGIDTRFGAPLVLTISDDSR